DGNDEAKVGADEVLTRLKVPRLDACAQLLLLLSGEQGDLVDLLKVGFEAAFG
ncbi:MAG: hypothetical protein ACJAQ3_004265, partial [Planctomycetota bacterium]